MKREVIADRDPKSPISEVFRTMRTNIQFMNTKGKLHSLLVTSTLSGEGKSWITANLAVTFAQAGKKVIILDGDMRKGRQFNIFGVSPRPGLSNYLAETIAGEYTDLAYYIQETEIPNLYLIPAGNVPPNPSELLGTNEMVNLLEQLKKLCDIVIIDGTPGQLVTDALILTRMVDSTIIVTASKETKKEDLKRVIGNIKKVGGNIAGIIVNKIPISAKKYEETFYYGSTSMRNTESKSINRNKESHMKNSRKKENSGTDVDAIVKRRIDEKKAETLKSNINIDRASASLEKTNDILNQMNRYLDEEKKKLK